MASRRAQLSFLFAKTGRLLTAQCSVCRVQIRVRKTAGHGKQKLIEIYCPKCQSTLFLASDLGEIKRSFTRAVKLLK